MSWIKRIVCGLGGGTTAPPTTVAPTTSAPTTAAPSGTGVTKIEFAGGATVAGSASADTKGAWTEMQASSANDYTELLVIIGPAPSISNVQMLIDIGIGGAGSEQVIVPNIGLDQSVNLIRTFDPLRVPIAVPAGTRFAARLQSEDGGSDEVEVRVIGIVGGSNDLDTVDILGVDEGNTAYTDVDPGAVVSTKGSYVEFTPSLPNDWAYVGILSMKQNLSGTSCNWNVDVAVGAAAAEVPVIEDFPYALHSNHDTPWPRRLGLFPLDIAAGSRISVRASCDITDVTDRVLHLALIGVRA